MRTGAARWTWSRACSGGCAVDVLVGAPWVTGVAWCTCSQARGAATWTWSWARCGQRACAVGVVMEALWARGAATWTWSWARSGRSGWAQGGQDAQDAQAWAAAAG